MFLCLADTGLQRTISYFSTRARVWLSALFCSDDAQAARLVASRARVGTVEYGRGAVQVTVHSRDPGVALWVRLGILFALYVMVSLERAMRPGNSSVRTR